MLSSFSRNSFVRVAKVRMGFCQSEGFDDNVALLIKGFCAQQRILIIVFDQSNEGTIGSLK